MAAGPYKAAMSLSLSVPTSLEYFASLVQSDDHFPLLEAAASLAQDEYPEFDVQQLLGDVDQLQARIKRRLPADAPALQRLRTLNQFFFADLGFGGNINNYYDPENSYLNAVLRTRRGIPISLAVLWMELAQGLGLHARGIAFPGHFMVKVLLPKGQVVLDPMTGQSLSREELAERLEPYQRRSGLVGEYELPLGQFHPQHRQADGNAPACAQHRVQVAVVGVVVVVDVARKAQVGIKELVEHVQPLQRRGIAGQAPADAGLHLVHIAQQLLHIQLRVLVLRDAGGGFEQRKVLVALHQASEILQGRRNGIAQGHGRFLGGGRRAVKAQNRGLYPGVTATAPRAKNAQRRSICRSLSPAAHRAPKYTTAAAIIRASNSSTRWPLWARRATQSK